MQFSLLRPKFISTKLKTFHSNSETNYKPVKKFLQKLVPQDVPLDTQNAVAIFATAPKNFCQNFDIFSLKISNFLWKYVFTIYVPQKWSSRQLEGSFDKPAKIFWPGSRHLSVHSPTENRILKRFKRLFASKKLFLTRRMQIFHAEYKIIYKILYLIYKSFLRQNDPLDT